MNNATSSGTGTDASRYDNTNGGGGGGGGSSRGTGTGGGSSTPGAGTSSTAAPVTENPPPPQPPTTSFADRSCPPTLAAQQQQERMSVRRCSPPPPLPLHVGPMSPVTPHVYEPTVVAYPASIGCIGWPTRLKTGSNQGVVTGLPKTHTQPPFPSASITKRLWPVKKKKLQIIVDDDIHNNNEDGDDDDDDSTRSSSTLAGCDGTHSECKDEDNDDGSSSDMEEERQERTSINRCGGRHELDDDDDDDVDVDVEGNPATMAVDVDIRHHQAGSDAMMAQVMPAHSWNDGAGNDDSGNVGHSERENFEECEELTGSGNQCGSFNKNKSGGSNGESVVVVEDMGVVEQGNKTGR